jgi:hypothetical protein
MSKSKYFNPLPAPGDIVWCRFPEALGSPGPKSRPALVLAVSPTTHEVELAYGTSKKTQQVYPGEFVVAQSDSGFVESGLSYTTKFDLSHRVKLPFNVEWFQAAPGCPGNIPLPKIGILHACFYKIAADAAATVAKKSGAP